MHLILGIDEVGRGSWAGPLVMGGVVLSPHEDNNEDWIEKLTDSKKLSPKKREELYDFIRAGALAAETGWVTAEELNKVGLSKGLRICCQRVVQKIQKTGVKFDEIIIDGSVNFLKQTPAERFVTNLNKADLLIKEVSAASIIAKVERDRYMINLSAQFPEFKFESHVGYGTAKHMQAISELGITPEHRLFIRPIREKIENGEIKMPDKNVYKNYFAGVGAKKNTTKIGKYAEAKIAEFLIQNGHEIIAMNYKTKVSEIDVVTRKNDKIYFTEVKYRKNNRHGGGIDAITPKKKAQMEFAAEVFMKNEAARFAGLSYALAAAAVEGADFKIIDWFEV